MVSCISRIPVCDAVATLKKRYMKTEARFRFHISLFCLSPMHCIGAGMLTYPNRSESHLAVEYSKHQYKRYPKRFGGVGDFP